jgi:hypothetical protein
MNWDVTADTLHRTVKLLMDSGKARTPEEARSFLESRVLQVAVGREIGGDLAAQAALLTVINAGHRAFLGGVLVHLDGTPRLDVSWAAGLTLSEAVVRFGGQIVDHLDSARPTLAIARPADPVGAPLLYVTHRGWVGGVVESRDALLEGGGTEPAGIAAGALGLSEAFQHELGDPVPGRRDVGVSLWRPDLHWCDPRAIGSELLYLPASLWLLGLGHLGQAYGWVLGMLPYACPGDVSLGLVDYDGVVEGNLATQLLVRPDDVDRRKTRVVANALEALGFHTVIVERAFDENFHPDIRRSEPTIALAGFDSRQPRLLLGDDRLPWVVDGGLGTGAVEYLDIVVNTFPSPQDPAAAFPPARPRRTPLPDAYEAEIACQVEGGASDEAVRCGILAIAGVNIGAAFVGAFAATLVVSDVLRLLNGGEPFSVVHVDLRHPENLRAVPNTAPGAPTPAFTKARSS